MKSPFSFFRSFLRDSSKTALGIFGGFLMVGLIGGAYASFNGIPAVPPEANFDSGKILRSEDIKSLSNNARESRTQLENFSFLEGNVGIGVAVPGEKLEIAGNAKIKTITGNAELKIQSGENNTNWGIYQDSGNLDLNFWNTDNRMTITNEGNVGIGTTSPQAKLEVDGGYMRGQFDCRIQDTTRRTDGDVNSAIAYADCGSDEFLLTGGGWCDAEYDWHVQNSTPDPLYYLGYPHFNAPYRSGDTWGWVINCFRANLSGDAQANARAVCCKK
jgi:hypothetical protein